MKQLALVAALFVCILLGTPGAADAARLNQYVGFGDSTQDSGYFRYNTTGSAVFDKTIADAVARGASGAFVGPGVMNSAILAGKFGLNGAAIGGGGFNYANGGAFSAPLRPSAGDPYLSGVSAPTNVSTNQQIQNYLLSTGGAANPNALYVIKTSDNDLQFVRAMPPAWAAANPNFLSNLAAGEAMSAAALQAAGARTLMVPNSYNYAVFAGLGGGLAPENADLYARSLSYGQARWADLAAAGVRFIPADIDSLMRFVVLHPTMFGFTPSSVLSANTLSPSLSPLLVSWDNVTPAQMQSNLFIGANGVHFTTAGQQIEADYEHGLIVAPSQMSLLAEGPVQGGLARAATIQGQIDLSGQHRGQSGVNVWATGGVGSLNIRNTSGFPDESGTPFTGSAGVDYQTAFGLILGAAFTAGTQTQNFNQGAGHFDQTDQAFSLYTACKAGPVWGNAVASYGLYQDKITRIVPLGLFTDQNNANTTGQSLALALRAGGDIKLGPVTTGPVAGLVLQQVTIKGFTESGTSGVNALSFGGQTRESVVSQLGWRVLVDVAKWRPFAEAKWNHEFAGQGRMVKASITTATAKPYSMDAAPVATDWGTASLGTSYKINDQWMLRVAGSAMFTNPQVVSYGGELGVSVSF
ncbi:autotransporter outer membrane beta-barrel domain-containing protein [Fundidesulfovibrio terrae]|uniref:autotransporter outer membrane beta-barrel domain-containing protein n=1 Tax=Fundidesulfovibrio terrae TaxID=2922866 RepID=UPI001FAF2FD2|nr:autotransporter domain-containing protein [Fundidesulfovibrio terrae]